MAMHGMKMKKKGMAKGGANMKKKGYAAGGAAKPDFLDIDKDGNKTESMKAASADRKGMKKKGMAKGGATMKKKGMAKGGAMMKKKAYAKGGKVAMYNVGGMVKSSGELNTGIARAKNTYK